MQERTPYGMDPIIDWPNAPPSLSLGHSVAHVWACPLRCSERTLQDYTALLSPEEYVRMQRFVSDKHRDAFAVCHASLRILLGRYLGQHPASIQFTKNNFGKPYLASDFSPLGLRFNLSHTRHLALLAVTTRELEVGVDVEELRPIDTAIAERFFSARERAELRTLAGPQWQEGFFNCWTRKEAILKAEGVGIGVSLDAFDVSLSPGDTASLVEFRPMSGVTGNWHIVDLHPAPGFTGALATKAAPREISCYRFLG